MKNKLKAVQSFGLALVLTFSVALAGCSSGCKAGKGTLNPTTGVYDSEAQADRVVVTAEKTAATALDVFDKFMQFERQNEATLAGVSPKIHQAAEEIRKNGRQWLTDLDNAKVAYQSNRTASNQVNLQQILATIQSAISSAISYMATSVAK